MNQSLSSSQVLHIIQTIKDIQTRMKELTKLSYIEMYHQLSTEFELFYEKHTTIFTKVIRGDDLTTIAAILYYKDKVDNKVMTESDLSQKLAQKYLPTHP